VRPDLIRARVTHNLSEPVAENRRALLARVAADWRLMPIAREIVERARRPFPSEPIRSLDAIHLASALSAADSLPDLVLLSVDHRVRAAGQLLGLRLAPE
jgi:hypothetical protein